FLILFITIPIPPISTLFPYTTLFRSIADKMQGLVKDINHQVVKQYNRTIHKEFKEVIRKQSLKDYALETIMTELYEWLPTAQVRSEEHTSELQSPYDLVCRLLLEKKK